MTLQPGHDSLWAIILALLPQYFNVFHWFHVTIPAYARIYNTRK